MKTYMNKQVSETLDNQKPNEKSDVKTSRLDSASKRLISKYGSGVSKLMKKHQEILDIVRKRDLKNDTQVPNDN